MVMVRVRERRIVPPERAGISVYARGRGERPCSVAARTVQVRAWVRVRVPAQRGDDGWGRDEGGRVRSALLEDGGGGAREERFGEVG